MTSLLVSPGSISVFCCRLDGLDSSSNFQLFQPTFQAFGRSFQVCQSRLSSQSLSCSMAFIVLWQGLSTCPTFRFLLFSLYSPLRRPSPVVGKLCLFLVIISRSGLLTGIWGYIWISKSPRILCVLFSKTDSD